MRSPLCPSDTFTIALLPITCKETCQELLLIVRQAEVRLVLLHQLNRKFSALIDRTTEQINALNSEQLAAMALPLLNFRIQGYVTLVLAHPTREQSDQTMAMAIALLSLGLLSFASAPPNLRRWRSYCPVEPRITFVH